MKIVSRDSLKLGGFAGIQEHRIVTDSRLFGTRRNPQASEGFGSLVYLADAQYNPRGESGVHPHSEIDVISVIIEGRVSHEGSMEHGKNLIAGKAEFSEASDISEEGSLYYAQDGDLIRSIDAKVIASQDFHMLVASRFENTDKNASTI